MAEHAGPLPRLGGTLDARLGPSVTVNIFTQQNFVVLPGQQQGNGQVNCSIKPADYTCGSVGPTNATVAQQAYPNMHPHQEDARRDLYHQPNTHREAYWQTDPTTNAGYNLARASYTNAAVAGPAMQQAAAMDGYAQTKAIESARQGAAYAAQ